MTFVLGAKSLSRLVGVHPDLVRVVKKAITLTEIDFAVLEGLRTKERQLYLFQKGASKTLKSRHIQGFAVDLVAMPAGKVSWDVADYTPIAQAMKQASIIEKVKIEHGGDWKSFPDYPHFQLPHATYPDK